MTAQAARGSDVGDTKIRGRRAEDRDEIHLYNKREIQLVRGEGVYLWDSDGRRYLDAMSNYGVNVLGHRHPAVDAAIRSQLDKLVSCHQSFYNDAREEFEEALVAHLPASLSRLSYGNSGAEAVEAAIKYARAWSDRRRIIAAEHGYHGRTMGALSVTSGEKHQAPFRPLLAECEAVAFDDLDALAAALPGAAALILEPIQGEAGVNRPAAGYLREVRELCDRHGVLMILDEVQTGMGRTGKLFAFEHEGVVPDILVVSKGIANGIPMGVTVVSEAVAGRVATGAHGSTFAGNPLACAAATATLRTLTGGDMLERVAENGAAFVTALTALNHRAIREVRGQGFMVAVELRERVTPYLRGLQQEGVLALPAGNRAIRFLPPLISEMQHLQTVVETLQRVLERSSKIEG
ncbi:MAG TPA: aspartate aminotransferase family protein [Chloroflexota bacterium]|nr:aspartate aminotransferase family protein [Chloroflexota bacterium]